MDPTRFDALTRAVGERRSRRDALRLLVGGTLGALALGQRPVPAEAAVTALPAFSIGWTDLTGTTSGLLFYKSGTGRAVTGTLVDGRFAQKATYTGFATSWSTITGAARSLLFSNGTDHTFVTGYIDAAGAFAQPSTTVHRDLNQSLPVPATRSGRYPAVVVANDGSYLTFGALTNDGRLVKTSFDAFDLAGGWWIGAGAGYNACLFYHPASGNAVSGLIDAQDGRLSWVPRVTYAFGPGWSHLAGTFNGGFLLYSRASGRAATGYLDADGAWHRVATVDVGHDWTHVVGAGSRGVLFYNRNTGEGVGGFLRPTGVWTKTTTYDCVPNGDPCQASGHCCSGRCGFIEPGRGFCAA